MGNKVLSSNWASLFEYPQNVRERLLSRFMLGNLLETVLMVKKLRIFITNIQGVFDVWKSISNRPLESTIWQTAAILESTESIILFLKGKTGSAIIDNLRLVSLLPYQEIIFVGLAGRLNQNLHLAKPYMVQLVEEGSERNKRGHAIKIACVTGMFESRRLYVELSRAAYDAVDMESCYFRDFAKWMSDNKKAAKLSYFVILSDDPLVQHLGGSKYFTIEKLIEMNKGFIEKLVLIS